MGTQDINIEEISPFRQLVRGLALSAFIFVALLHLKSSIHIAWLSGGPANPYPADWLRRTIEQFCFSLSYLCYGIGVFKGIRTFPAATREAAVILVLGAVLSLGPYIVRFNLIEKCHNRGGTWNRETMQCSDK
jgi:hypothetical protein